MIEMITIEQSKALQRISLMKDKFVNMVKMEIDEEKSNRFDGFNVIKLNSQYGYSRVTGKRICKL